MVKSTRSLRQSKSKQKVENNESYSDITKSDFIKGGKRGQSTTESNSKNINSRLMTWSSIAVGLILLLLLTGVFAPNTNPSNNDFIKGEDLPENTFTQANGAKISIVLYSSPTCGCCHEYVEYLNNNGFDTFQKRTETYQVIKRDNLIPEEQWSCHTAIIGDYFIEGHIPLSVVYDMLTQKPEIDGISLPGMPSGSPGMEGEKNAEWVILSILNGDVIGTLARV